MDNHLNSIQHSPDRVQVLFLLIFLAMTAGCRKPDPASSEEPPSSGSSKGGEHEAIRGNRSASGRGCRRDESS